MRFAVEGPNCVDPLLCRGDCCSIKIDIPKILAEEYIKRGYACEGDFIRSDTFSFQLRFNENTRKCFLFDPKLNGCSIHNSGIKPVQCWIYPTGFSDNSGKEIRCKKYGGWKILDAQKAKKAENILKKYVFLCKIEAKKELRNIPMRLKATILNSSFRLLEKFKIVKPCELAGIIDKWDYFDILLAEGFSLQMKKFCHKFNPECKLIPDNYFECSHICTTISEALFTYLSNSLYEFVKINGQNGDGEYRFIDLFNFRDIKIGNI